MISERKAPSASGYLMLLVSLMLWVLSVLILIEGVAWRSGGLVVLAVLVMTTGILFLVGLFVVNPNEGRVIQLFG